MKRQAMIVAAALAAAAGMGASVVPAAQADGAREARAGAKSPDRERGPGGLSSQMAKAFLSSSRNQRGGRGGYRRWPRGSHKQKRRVQLKKNARRASR